MVSVNPINKYELREYLINIINKSDSNNQLMPDFLRYLSIPCSETTTELDDPLYLSCAQAGFLNISEKKSDELARLLGQSSFIDGTPMQWVGDPLVVLGIKLAVKGSSNSENSLKFFHWANNFMPQRIRDDRLSCHEKALAEYMLNDDYNTSSACVALFLHYKNLLPIFEKNQEEKYIRDFFDDFKDSYKLNHPPLILALFVYVFDTINHEKAYLPPNYWSPLDVIKFLENIPAGLQKWTWEVNERTKNSRPVQWVIANEYHVQNLLYLMLAPIFPSITSEQHTEPVGQRTSRLDLYLPSINTLIEIKYRKTSGKSFSKLIEEIAADTALYKSDPRFKKSTFLVFLWDHTRATEEHTNFKQGILKLEGVSECVIVCSPSVMILSEN